MQPHENRLIFDSRVLRIWDYRCRGQDGVEQHTRNHEIVVPRSGGYLRRSVWGESVADANHVLFFHRDQPYDVHHPDAGEDRSTIFELKGDAAVELAGAFDPDAAQRPGAPFPVGDMVLSRPPRLDRLAGPQHPSTPGDVDTLELEERVVLYLGTILGEAFENLAGNRSPSRAGSARDHQTAVRRTQLVLRRRFSEKLTLDDVAQAAGYSPYYLCRVFRQQTGLSIHRYLQHLRLGESLDLLAEFPQRPITAIAFDLGYASLSHFSAAFQRQFGISASDYRSQASRSLLRQKRRILKA